MIFSALKTELSDRGFSYLTDTRLGQYINWARAELDDLDAWPYRIATATGAAPLTVTDLGWVQGVQDTGTKLQLLPIDRESLADRYDDLTITGTPQFYYATDGVVNTYPVGGTISVRYNKVPVDLSAAGDSPLAPVRFHRLIVDLAVRMAYRDSDNHEAAEQLQAQVERDLMLMRMALLVNNTDGPDGYVQLRETW